MYPCKTPCNIGVLVGDYKSSDSITIDALLKAGGIKGEAGSFKILSYRIALDCAGCYFDLHEVNNIGDKFGENALVLFKRLRRGVFITIDCITAKDANGYITGLKPGFYVIR